ncbi:hypothetical protein [Ruminococcus bicirculans (ex Wegman et al. 2014)]
MNTEKKKIKVDLVTGFLGAGKTTFRCSECGYASFAGAFGRELRP